MKKVLYILLFVLPVLFSGCIGYEEIKVVRIKDVTYQEFRGSTLRLAIVATIDNPNYFNVKIADANMVLRLQDNVIGVVTQVEQVALEGRKEKDYTIQVSIEMKDMITNVLNIARIFMNDPKNLSLSGTLHVKSFLYSKTFQIENLSFQ